MAELTPQRTVKAVLNALHSGSADFVVQVLGTPGGDYFCRRWNSGLQELMQKDVNDADTEYCTVTFSVGFTKAPHVVLSINESSGKTGWLTVIAPRQITTTNFLISRNSTLNKTLVFTAYGRWK